MLFRLSLPPRQLLSVKEVVPQLCSLHYVDTNFEDHEGWETSGYTGRLAHSARNCGDSVASGADCTAWVDWVQKVDRVFGQELATTCPQNPNLDYFLLPASKFWTPVKAALDWSLMQKRLNFWGVNNRTADLSRSPSMKEWGL